MARRQRASRRYDSAMADSGVRLSDLLVSLSLGHRPRLRAAARAHAPLGADRHAPGRAAGPGRRGPGHPLRRRHPDLRRVPGLRQRGGDPLRRRHRLPGARHRGRPGRVPGHGVHAAAGRRTARRRSTGPARPPRSWPPGGARWSSRWRTTARRPARSPTRLGLGEDVQAGIEQAYARWDGRGVPRRPVRHRACRWRPGSRTSPKPARCSSGPPASKRRSTWSARGAAPTSTPRSPSSWSHGSRVVVRGPRPRTPSTRSSPPSRSSDGPLTDDELDQALEAIGDFCDLRCPYFAGHARGTADLVRGAAELMQMPAADARLAYRAALVHDVGRFGVPGSVWGQARTVDRQRAGADAPARLLRRADLQPARAAAPDRPAGGHPPRADGRLRLPPRCRRDDAVARRPGSWRPPTPTAP